MPEKAISIPATHMKRARPTEPERERISEGVAKIPVPTMRLKIRKMAEMVPTWRRLSEVLYSSTASLSMLGTRVCSRLLCFDSGSEVVAGV
jgi:hypothetical protein